MASSRARQPGLFEVPQLGPQGFRYQADFLSQAEETQLAAWLGSLDFRPFEFRGYQGRRRVISFGWQYDFSRSRLLKAHDMPTELEPLRARAADLAGLQPDALQQVLLNQYQPGAPIGWHRDRPVFAEVVGISLLAPCLFRFRRRTESGFERIVVPLAPRSAYVLSGEARQAWEHSIPPASALRYSITFRSFRTTWVRESSPTTLPDQTAESSASRLASSP